VSLPGAAELFRPARDDELLALEQARLTLRAFHGLAVDRNRTVWEAVVAALADLESAGEGSELVRRLGGP
jgi:hypothetical protein